MANELKDKCVRFFIHLKIKSIVMQTTRIVQAAILMMIVAITASCAASKEYSSKLFAARTPLAKDSQAVALRFLDLDRAETNKEDWVTTDIIMGRDTVNNTSALDKLAKIFPSTPVTTTLVQVDTVTKTTIVKITPSAVETKPSPVESQAVAKNFNSGEVRSKKTREK